LGLKEGGGVKEIKNPREGGDEDGMG